MDKKKMHIYKLKRTEEIDKGGRPAIFLKKFKKKSLVWAGTTVLRTQDNEIPLEIKFDDKIGYFYSHNLDTVKSKYLIEEWKKDKISNEIFVLNSEQEKQLISKFTEFTNQEDPYKRIKTLEEKINNYSINIIQFQKETIKNLNNKIIKLEQEIKYLKNNQEILTNEKEFLDAKIQKQKPKEYEQE